MLKWNVSKTEEAIIGKIVKRATAKIAVDPLELDMDITACHVNCLRLDLAGLVEADDFDFMHDVFGIRRHLNRKTGQLEDCFLPRCARKEPTP